MVAVVVSAGAAAVAGVFTVALLRRYLRRGRVNRALVWWALSLGMFGVAALTLAYGAAVGWSSGWFRLYYLLGGVLVVPWLALGTVESAARDPVVLRALGATSLLVGVLLALPLVTAEHPSLFLSGVILAVTWGLMLVWSRGRSAVTGSLVLVAVLSTVAAVAVLAARLQGPVPAGDLPEGRELFAPAVRGLAVGANAVGAVLVVVGAAVSALRLRGRGLPHLVAGNLLIGFGVLVAASGGTFAFLGATEGHAIAFALGVTLMYLGFVRTTRPAQGPAPAAAHGRSRRRTAAAPTGE